MPSYTPSSSSSAPPKPDLQTILSSALPFLRGDLSSIDPSLPSLVSTLRSAGAADCWHKHGSFLSHLLGVHRILSLWSAPSALSLAGLFHSAYSNSYVNLAIFDPSTSRAAVRDLIGAPAEHLVHLFCVVPRHSLIHDHLLSHYPSDDELRHHLLLSDSPLHAAPTEPWRIKLQSILPAHGLTVKHIKTGEDVPLSRRVVASFLLMTIADFSDQLFSFQDDLFLNDNGRLDFSGNNFTALWPGDGKPGLWMNSASRMAALYTLIAREEEIETKNQELQGDRDHEDMMIELVIPPIFESCSQVLGAEEQIEGRDLYWEAVSGGGGVEKAERLLKESCEKNPFVGETWIVLGQVYLGMGRYEEGEKVVEKGLRLVLEWGSSWDKRMGWDGWVAWGRVLLMKAREKDWPHTSWGILNLGLVK